MVTPLPFPRPPEPLPHCTQSFAPDWYPFTGEEVHCPTTLSVRPSIADMEKSNKFISLHTLHVIATPFNLYSSAIRRPQAVQ